MCLSHSMMFTLNIWWRCCLFVIFLRTVPVLFLCITRSLFFRLIQKSTTWQRVIFLVYFVCSFSFISPLNVCVPQGFIIGPLRSTIYTFYLHDYSHFCGFNYQSYLSSRFSFRFQMHIFNCMVDIFIKGHLNIPLSLLAHNIICPNKLETCESLWTFLLSPHSSLN